MDRYLPRPLRQRIEQGKQSGLYGDSDSDPDSDSDSDNNEAGIVGLVFGWGTELDQEEAGETEGRQRENRENVGGKGFDTGDEDEGAGIERRDSEEAWDWAGQVVQVEATPFSINGRQRFIHCDFNFQIFMYDMQNNFS